MKTLLFFLSTLFCCLIFSSFKTGAETVNYFITKDGDSVQVKDEVTMDVQYMYYKDIKGKSRTIPQSKIKKMFIGGRFFINLPIMSMGMTRLQEVIATNRSYILTIYMGNYGYDAYIWNKQYENKENKIFVGAKKFEKKAMDKYIRKYFGSCKELIASMEANIEADKLFSEGIADYQCPTPATE